MKKLFFILVFLSGTFYAQSQSIAAYINFREQLMVFDDGNTKMLEPLPPQSYKVGPDYLAYIDNVSNLKVYYQGEVTILSPGVVLHYWAGDDYLVFELYQQIKVWHKGKLTNLGNNVTAFLASDSIVAFFDSNYKNFHIYYHNQEFDLGDGLVQTPISDFKIGNNIFAYIDKYRMTFSAFYNEGFYDLSSVVREVDFKVDADIVAYVDDQSNTFKAFFQGNIFDLETLPPKHYKVGHGMVAYVNQNDEFVVFYNGKKHDLLNYSPESYDIKDSLIIWNNQGFLNLFYGGEVMEVERYIPANAAMDWGTYSYLTENLQIDAVMHGVKMKVFNETLKDIFVYRNIIVIKYGNQSWAIHYRGKNYFLSDQ